MAQRNQPPPLIVPAALDDAGLDVYLFRALAHVARRAGAVGGVFKGERTRAARTCGMSLTRWKGCLKELLKLGVLVKLEERAGCTTRYEYRGDTGVSGDRVTTRPGHQKAANPVTRKPPTRSPGNHKGVPLKESREGVVDHARIERRLALAKKNPRRQDEGETAEQHWQRIDRLLKAEERTAP